MHTRFITDEREVILRTNVQVLRKVTGHSEFGGCQCSRDCNCHENFIKVPFTDYRVFKKWGAKHKTFTFGKKQDAYKKFRELTKKHKKWLETRTL